MSKRIMRKSLWFLLPFALAVAIPLLLRLPASSLGVEHRAVEASPSGTVSQTPNPEQPFLGSASEETFSLWGVAADLGVKLSLVIGLAYLTIKLWKRALIRRSPLPHGKSFINILEFSHLGHNQTLYLVRVGERILLVGATAGQMTLLSEVSDAISLSAEEELQPGQAASERFAQYMKLADEKLAHWLCRTKLSGMPRAILACIQGRPPLGGKLELDQTCHPLVVKQR